MARLLQLVAALAAVSSVAYAAPLDERAFLPTPPSDDAFYAVPASGLDSLSPGTILDSRAPPKPIAALGLLPANLQNSYQFRYRTTDSFGKPTVTVLTVLVPFNADKTKVLSYQTAEDSAWINCAPSFALQFASGDKKPGDDVSIQGEALFIEAALAQGWVVIVPDYQGPQGAFLANKQAAHAILDGIRAAVGSGSLTGIDSNAAVAMWGYSGGSISTGSAAEYHQSYAPELNIVTAVIGGTVPDIRSVVATVNKGPFAGLIPSGVLGLANVYPELADYVDKNLKPEHKAAWQQARGQCLTGDIGQFPFQDVLGHLQHGVASLDDEVVARISKENDLGHTVPTIPMFVYNAINDEVTPINNTDRLVDYYCDNGASVQYRRDTLSEHATLFGLGAPLALSHIKDVFDGKPQPEGCTRKNVLTSLLDPGAVKILPGVILKGLLALLHQPIGPGINVSGILG